MLRDRTILITGGGSGIGLALAEVLTARGNTVIVCGRDPAKLALARQQVPRLEVRTCDVTDDTAVEGLFDDLAKSHPQLDVLVNNAAVFHLTYTASDIDPRLVTDEVTTDMVAPMALTARFLDRTGDRPALVLSVGSLSAWLPLRSQPVYAATKAALHSWSTGLRDLLAAEMRDVRIVEVMTPATDTDMTTDIGVDKMTPQRLAAEIVRQVDRGRQEIVVGWQGLLTVALSRLSPRLALRIANGVAERGLPRRVGVPAP